MAKNMAAILLWYNHNESSNLADPRITVTIGISKQAIYLVQAIYIDSLGSNEP